MTKVDSKIFLGCILGKYKEIYPRITALYPPLSEDHDIYTYIGYLNYKLPNNIFIHLTYPKHGCPVSEITFHLDFMSCDFLPLSGLKEFLDSLDMDVYKLMLDKLNIPYKEPELYSEHYIY